MQKARRHFQKEAPTACRRMVSGSLSTSCSECFSPFPHGTRPLSVSREYLALPDGPGGFTQGSTCPALLRMPLAHRLAARTQLSCSTAGLSSPFRSPSGARERGPTTPGAPRRAGFGLLPVRSPLLGESFLFSSPAGTKMFQFPAFASRQCGIAPERRWVFPFGHPRINGHLHLRADFRSLSRPSSPPGAKASAMRPCFLLFLKAAPAACLRATCHRTKG